MFFQYMTPYDDPLTHAGNEKSQDQVSVPVVIATMLRPTDFGGVDTHVRQIRAYLETRGTPCTLVTPFSWGRLLTYPAVRPPSGTCERLQRVGQASYGTGTGMRCSCATRCAGDLAEVGRLRRLRSGSARGPGGPARAAGTAPARSHGGSLPGFSRPTNDAEPGKGDQTRRDRIPGDPAARTRGYPAGRWSRVRVQVGAGRAIGLAAGGCPRCLPPSSAISLRPCILSRPGVPLGDLVTTGRPRSAEEPPFPAGGP